MLHFSSTTDLNINRIFSAKELPQTFFLFLLILIKLASILCLVIPRKRKKTKTVCKKKTMIMTLTLNITWLDVDDGGESWRNWVGKHPSALPNFSANWVHQGSFTNCPSKVIEFLFIFHWLFCNLAPSCSFILINYVLWLIDCYYINQDGKYSVSPF